MSKADRIKNNPKKLLKLLTEGGYEDRAKAAYHLDELGDSSFFPELKNALYDPVPVVVNEVVSALQKIGMDETTKEEIVTVLQKFKDQEQKLNNKVSNSWKEKTEEEKQEELRRYAAESHLRDAERKVIRQDEGFNKNWLYASVILGIVLILYYLM